MRKTYGKLLPGMKLGDLAGKLIVIEGTDGAGRTTQINLLKPWLEELGHAVLDTGMTRSRLAGDGIRRAKEGNNLGRVTQTPILRHRFHRPAWRTKSCPALRAGFIVLTDRYIYSLMARAIVRGMDAAWIRSIFSVALVPDAVFYLRIGVEELIPRVVFSRGFDYWESGMDVFPGHDMYESFAVIRPRCWRNSTGSSAEYNFEIVDAAGEVEIVFAQLKSKIQRILERNSRATYDAKHRVEPALSPNHQFENPFVSALVASALKEPRFSFPTAAPNASNGNGNGHRVTQQK